MTESQLTAKLVAHVRKHRPHAVVFKHNDRITAGIPDLSVTVNERTTWLEAKTEMNWPPTKLQRRTMLRLRDVGLAFYLYFYKTHNRWRMAVIHPDYVDQTKNDARIFSHMLESLTDDFNKLLEEL